MRRSQPTKPQATKIDNQKHTAPIVFFTAQNEVDAGSQALSARVIAANVLTCEPARTSILFLGAKRFSAFGFTPACNSFRRAIYSFNFTDVDGHTLSTSDGHVTSVVLTTPADSEKAHTVGDHVPDYCLGNPNYRMITVIHFTRGLTAIGRKLITPLVKRRVNEEAKRPQARYDAKKITRDARTDIF